MLVQVLATQRRIGHDLSSKIFLIKDFISTTIQDNKNPGKLQRRLVVTFIEDFTGKRSHFNSLGSSIQNQSVRGRFFGLSIKYDLSSPHRSLSSLAKAIVSGSVSISAIFSLTN